MRNRTPITKFVFPPAIALMIPRENKVITKKIYGERGEIIQKEDTSMYKEFKKRKNEEEKKANERKQEESTVQE